MSDSDSSPPDDLFRQLLGDDYDGTSNESNVEPSNGATCGVQERVDAKIKVVELIANHIWKRRNEVLPQEFDYYQAELETKYLEVVIELVRSILNVLHSPSCYECAEAKLRIMDCLGKLRELQSSVSPKGVAEMTEALEREVEGSFADVETGMLKYYATEEFEDLIVGTVYGPVGHIEQEPGKPPRLVMRNNGWVEVEAALHKAIKREESVIGLDRRAHRADELESMPILLETLSLGELTAILNR